MRDRFPDLLRSVALGAVILGHWTMGAVSVDAHGLMHVDNVLNINRFLWPATWLLMLIPLFFFVGGFSNATSLTRAREKGFSSGQWVRKRLKNTLVPVVPFVAVIVGIVLVALQFGAPRTLTLTVAVVVLMPLWFVIVYAALACLAPALLAAHNKHGIRIVVALAVLACITDGLRTAFDEPFIGYLNYVFVHGTMQQLGFFYFDGRLQLISRKRLILWAGAAFLALCAVVATPIWSESMVGMSGERSNMSPPSIPSLLHGLWLVPMVMIAYPWLKERIDGPKISNVLDTAAAYSMRAFLWHLPVLVLVSAILFVIKAPFPEPGTATWWITRPIMIAVLSVCLRLWLRVGDHFKGWRSTKNLRR